MRTLAATALAAIAASSYRAGWAVEVTLADEGAGVRYWRWCAAGTNLTIGGNLYTAHPISVEGSPSYGDQAMGSMTVGVADALDVVRTELRNDPQRLKGRAISISELLTTDPATAPAAVPWFVGGIESVSCVEGWATFHCAPLVQIWALPIPDPISALCRYRSTDQCPYVGQCLGSYAACTANAKTDIFGGWRFIPVTGTRVEFRDGGVTIVGGAR